MKLSVERIRINRHGYDSGGRYWGVGDPLYRVGDDADLDEYVRASSAKDARAKVLAKLGKTMPKKTKKKSAVERVCSSSGYAYELLRPTLGPRRGDYWRTRPDEDWEAVLIDAAPVKVLGKRYVDGAEVVVFELRGKVYAQTALHVKKC